MERGKRLVYTTDGESYEEEEGANYVTFGKQVLKSVQAGYIKRLDFAFYRQLDKPLSRQLYRFLDRRLRYRNRFEIDIFDLANRLGMASYSYPLEIKKVTVTFEVSPHSLSMGKSSSHT